VTRRLSRAERALRDINLTGTPDYDADDDDVRVVNGRPSSPVTGSRGGAAVMFDDKDELTAACRRHQQRHRYHAHRVSAMLLRTIAIDE